MNKPEELSSSRAAVGILPEGPRPFALRFAEPLQPSDPPPNIPWCATSITTWETTPELNRADPHGSDPD